MALSHDFVCENSLARLRYISAVCADMSAGRITTSRLRSASQSLIWRHRKRIRAGGVGLTSRMPITLSQIEMRRRDEHPAVSLLKHIAAFYQTNLALTCPMRGSRALVTCPKLALLMSPLGLKNCAWLNTLKNSPRISNAFFSVTGIRLVIPKSVLLIPGPWKNRRFAVPKVPQSALGRLVIGSKKQLVATNALWSKYVNVPGVLRGFRM